MIEDVFGVIDIGSNSVRLMLWQNGKTLEKSVITTRLSEGMMDNILVSEPIERTIKAVVELCNKANEFGVKKIYIFATEAVRKATNKQVLLNSIKKQCNLDVDVVKGEEEADLALMGALQDKDGGVIDIGGASSEIAFSKNGVKIYSKSVDIGAGRLTDMFNENIESLSNFLEDKILEYGNIPLGDFVCVGGTATSYAAMVQQLEVYDVNKVDGFRLTYNDVKSITNSILSKSIEERYNIKGLHPSRVKIIATGGIILISIMKACKIDHVVVSEKDNLEGYIIKKLRNGNVNGLNLEKK